ncbi:5-oxoprolinase subunit PxpB [Terasakiella sp. A23]|uniref:5-oxoprolinase subunit PxpB n=1 Tax=Terasakiella sp. FCG-A23 TaxID=3080561 RepID=UPI0029530642|nr:5-oxoprolinase subunit PxpB [Terasakiella sp. A23]MDV7338237.1 5-oxoprolinase subunit PxpB [Terasakiella sp. A23]
MDCSVLYLADRAITFEFGDEISIDINRYILVVHHMLKEEISQGHMAGLIETVPTFRSLTVHYDPLKTLPDEVEALVRPYLVKADHVLEEANHWDLPCCYDLSVAPDLEEVAVMKGVAVDEIVKAHARIEYDVFMLGFLPGFGFMGVTDPLLQLPRRAEPRTAVPKGSVAIANQLTAVYPSVSPGGWHLIGRMPVPLFDLSRDAPMMLAAGDRVKFYPISRQEYDRIEQAVGQSDYSVERHCRRYQ